jgi:protein-tyrosine phosphatase
MDNGEDSRFLTKIDASEWLLHSRRILSAAVSVAEKLEIEKSGVLVHCSDGWDRTAQVCL